MSATSSRSWPSGTLSRAQLYLLLLACLLIPSTGDRPPGPGYALVAAFSLSPWSSGQVAQALSEPEDPTSDQTLSSSRSNVILVPGFGGSRLEMRLNKTHAPSYFCDLHTSDWKDMWINIRLLLPFTIDCLIDDMRLEFDPQTNMTHSPPGVQVRVKGADTLAALEYLHEIRIPGSAYFGYITDHLAESYDFQRDRTLIGAPYDFRKAPYELDDYFERLRERSEASDKPISYICHSMGCSMMLYFLQRQTAEWKARHVRRLIGIAAPWAGSYSALRAATLGHDLGVPYLFDHAKLVKVQRSLPSVTFMFPHIKVFGDEPMVRTHLDPDYKIQGRQTNYTASNLDLLLLNERLNRSIYLMWLNNRRLLGQLEAPGVEVWCFAGSGEPTLVGMDYQGGFPNSPSRERFGDGDGTVEIVSSSYCKHWAEEQEQPVYYREVKATHVNILRNNEVLDAIVDIIGDQNPNLIGTTRSSANRHKRNRPKRGFMRLLLPY